MSTGDARMAVSTGAAPPPAGAYSQAVSFGGLCYVSGQTPRTPDGTRRGDAPFAEQVDLVLDNLEAIASAAGSRLAEAVSVTVYLRDPARQAAEFDTRYRARFADVEVLPARAIVQSHLPHGDLEVTAVFASRV